MRLAVDEMVKLLDEAIPMPTGFISVVDQVQLIDEAVLALERIQVGGTRGDTARAGSEESGSARAGPEASQGYGG
jgi:hypothetical protein